MKRTEDGQFLPLIAMIGALILIGLIVLLGAVRNVVSNAARAQTAADAAALAGATSGEEAARVAASANGGKLIQFKTEGNDAIVTAEVGSSKAKARARVHEGP